MPKVCINDSQKTLHAAVRLKNPDSIKDILFTPSRDNGHLRVYGKPVEELNVIISLEEEYRFIMYGADKKDFVGDGGACLVHKELVFRFICQPNH